jgi:hypothetical protein
MTLTRKVMISSCGFPKDKELTGINILWEMPVVELPANNQEFGSV